jgi:hypothetical protein
MSGELNRGISSIDQLAMWNANSNITQNGLNSINMSGLSNMGFASIDQLAKWNWNSSIGQLGLNGKCQRRI